MRSMTQAMSEIVREAKLKTTFFGQEFLILIINSILGGFFIALSGYTFQKVMLFTDSIFPAAAILPMGFLLCDVFWSDLFSNNFLYAMAAYEKKIKWKSFIMSTLCITLFNIFGIVLFIGALYLAGSLVDVTAVAIKEVTMKANEGYVQTLFKGILGSICICSGTFIARRVDNALEKTAVIFLSVFIMCICGFEHATVDLYHFLVCPRLETLYYIPNLILTYLGNIIGGMIFAGLFSLEIDVKEGDNQ